MTLYVDGYLRRRNGCQVIQRIKFRFDARKRAIPRKKPSRSPCHSSFLSYFEAIICEMTTLPTPRCPFLDVTAVRALLCNRNISAKCSHEFVSSQKPTLGVDKSQCHVHQQAHHRHRCLMTLFVKSFEKQSTKQFQPHSFVFIAHSDRLATFSPFSLEEEKNFLSSSEASLETTAKLASLKENFFRSNYFSLYVATPPFDSSRDG